MSPQQIRIIALVALSLLSGLAATLLGMSRPGWSDAKTFVAGAALSAVILVVFDVLLRGMTTKRIRWIQRVGYELHEVARGERKVLSSSIPPGSDLDLVQSRFHEIRDAIVNQRRVLEQQKGTLQEILDGMGEGVLAIDDEKRIVLANDRICELFGVKRPEPGRQYYEVLRNRSLVEAFDHGLAGEPYRERSTVTIRGQERQIEIRVVPAGGESEIAAVALVIDVTQIEMLGRIRQDFIADFSHEVRTPLAGLRSSIEILHAGRLRGDQEEQLHRIVDRQLGRLERLVSDLAELNSIESGEMVLHREPTELKQLLSDLAQDFCDRASDRRIALIVEGTESIADVDPTRIEQVFSNLIENALRHAPASDVLTIEVGSGDDDVEVRVSDRGPGIPREEREKIFHRFYRVDKSRSGEEGGTGLGLAITKHLVIQHGGAISVESEIGKGTTFIVKLPKGER